MSLIPNVEEATKSVRAIPQLLDALAEIVRTPGGTIVFVLILVWFIKSIGGFHFFGSFQSRSRSRARALEKYLSDPGDKDPACVAALRDLNDAEHFRIATNIYAEKLRRTALIDLHRRVQHEVQWRGIRKALPYFEYHSDGSLSIRPFSMSDKLGYRYNQGMFLLGILGMVGSIVLLLLTRRTELQTIILAAGIPFSIFVALFSAYQNLPDYVASKIVRTLTAVAATGGSVDRASEERGA